MTEELTHLRSAGIDVRICPGITAASAAAASLGVSLTLRGMARRLQFVTAHARKGEALDLDWSALADPGATLAVYMGKSAASDVARQLIAAGMPADTTAIVIANASLPEERHLASRLALLPLAVTTGIGEGLALLLIGRAMGEATRPTDSCGRCHEEGSEGLPGTSPDGKTGKRLSNRIKRK